MDRNEANHSITCTVKECEYHSAHQDYCSLDTIKVGSHDLNPKDKKATDCESFEKKSH
jgi:hypothetical protein